MKTNQKSVRLSDKVCGYIEQYRGDSFGSKLENMVLDYMEQHERLVEDWKILNAHIGDKRDEMKRVQDRLDKLREVDRRVGPLIDVLVSLLNQP